MKWILLITLMLFSGAAMAMTPKEGFQQKLAYKCAAVMSARGGPMTAKFGRNVVPEVCQCASFQMKQRVIRLTAREMEVLRKDRKMNKTFVSNGMEQSINACYQAIRR